MTPVAEEASAPRIAVAVVPYAVPVIAGGVGIVAQLPFSDAVPAIVVIKALEAAGFALTAVLVTRRPGPSGNAAILATATLCLVFGWVHARLPGPVPLLAAILGPVFWALLGWFLLRLPGNALATRTLRIFVAVAFVWLGFGHFVVTILDDATWPPAAPYFGRWKPTLPIDRGTYRAVKDVAVVVDAVLAGSYVILALQRMRRMGGIDRWATTPLVASIAAGLVPIFVRVPSQVFGDRLAQHAQAVAQEAAVLLVPIALVAVLWRAQLARVHVASAMTQLAADASPDAVQITMQRALHDRRLRIDYWLAGRDCWVDEAGEAQPELLPDRLAVPIVSRDGRPLARIVTDPALAHHPGLLQIAVSAAGLTIENARLEVQLRDQLIVAQSSGQRVAQAATVERRRIERDLHDGAQQRLLALRLQLSAMEMEDAPAAAVIQAARREIRAASQELRDLSHGIRPLALSEGLAAAARSMADRLPVPCRVTIEERARPSPIESAAYFAVCELVANAVKHARARLIEVTGRDEQGLLMIAVADDGIGGASCDRGTGLRGVRERVEALGGNISIVSPTDHGTRVEIELPCASH